MRRPRDGLGAARPVAAGAAGFTWVVATFLPWTTSGVLSSSTLLEAARFARQGTLDFVPGALAVVLLTPVVTGLLLVGLVGFDGPASRRVRWAAGGTGCLVVVLLLARLTGADPARLGPGAWLAAAGAVAFFTEGALAILRKRPRRARGRP